MAKGNRNGSIGPGWYEDYDPEHKHEDEVSTLAVSLLKEKLNWIFKTAQERRIRENENKETSSI